ncbi:YT521-B-like domain-containing protein [Mycena latifolia]|nr:YT521-B-like domain-containing protein [Mycena latifolia]
MSQVPFWDPHLHAAIARFNGVSLRPADPRCPRLVCYVRGKDDDLRAGVGGQRGMGMHSRWVKAKSEKHREQRKEQGNEQQGREQGQEWDVDSESNLETASTSSNLSGSFASTNSSLLQRHFPQSYFILKSLTQDDLDLSVRTGVWTTQKHNESVLDRAFRTAKDVFLIFSVNRSREFYGYARMTGRVGQVDGERLTSSLRSSSTATRGPVVTASTRVSAPEDSWGQEFKLQWLCTARLPFQCTRHIRNPWNYDREVKVSRDGTELEPSVGQALLEEWRPFLAADGEQAQKMAG